MKKRLLELLLLPLLALFLLLGSCDEIAEDVIPISFQEFTLYPDEIYTFNSNLGLILRLDPLANDSLKAEAVVTYTQPKHGQLFPAFDGPGTMGYLPDNNFYGTDSLTYTVCTKSFCQTEKIKLIIEKPLDPNNCTTKLGADSLETTRNTFKGIRIFMNDIICFGENSGGYMIHKPLKGTYKAIEYAGSYKNTIYVYFPPKDYVGEDSFMYRVYTSRDRSTYEEVIVKVTVKEK